MNDLISRQMLLEYIHGEPVGRLLCDKYNLDGLIKQFPSAQPQRMRGRWIEIQAPDSDGNGIYECSVCHRGEVHVPIVEVPLCWHCGAYMKEA